MRMRCNFSLPLLYSRGSVTSTFLSRDCKGAVGNRRGSALLMVLWLTAALAAIGLTVASTVRGETERTQTSVDDARSWFEARGGIERAALHILWGRNYAGQDESKIYYEPGQPSMDLAFPSAAVHVDIIPETSKLNLNRSSPDELLRLLVALGTPEDRAVTITAAIVDWRTSSNPQGASEFDSFYLSQSPSFLPRHASFRENEELLLVQGMTSELYYGASLGTAQAGLRDCVSVYGTVGPVDINTAQPATLVAVGLSPADAQAIVQRRRPTPDHRLQRTRGDRSVARTGRKPATYRRPDHVHAARHRTHAPAGRQALRSSPHRGCAREVLSSQQHRKEARRIRSGSLVRPHMSAPALATDSGDQAGSRRTRARMATRARDSAPDSASRFRAATSRPLSCAPGLPARLSQTQRPLPIFAAGPPRSGARS